MSLSGKMLSSGCALHVEAIHGENITVLTGLDAGAIFTAVRESETDMVINFELGADPRAKHMLRFRDSMPAPRIGLNDRIKTADGKIWTAVRNPGDGFLTNDFELIEVTAKDT